MKALSIIGLIVFTAISALSQATSPSMLQIADRYWMQPDVVYAGANNTPLKLDIWYPRDNPNPTPTLVYIHGGGWIFGTKEGSVYQFLP
jgi:acetyl esterase/lipase